MGIEEFDPISQPKIIRSKAGIKALSDEKKLVIEAENNKVKEGNGIGRDE